jgi:hypothetical protein
LISIACFDAFFDEKRLMPQSIDGYNFSALSVRDLLDARDQYHFHLMNKANVVGTAIGRYLIRNKEHYPSSERRPKPVKGKRTLNNSSARDYSWPCVLVFVSEWLDERDFHAGSEKTPPGMIVPRTLYMPDGRAVPVCVVAVDPDESDPNEQRLHRLWPQHTFGGGLPITVDTQQERHLATAGCLVSDGNQLYALTARHVCGTPGTPIYGTLRGGRSEIGVGSDKQLTRKLFSEVYPSFTARQTYLNLDVGLIRLDDANQWTCNVYGLPPIKAVYDLYEQNISLRLLEKEVVGFGAATGHLRGEIKALFYRYRSVGGFDYVSDFLISPKQGTPNSRHGDSGTIWHIDVTADEEKQERRKHPRKHKHPAPKPLRERDLRPFAIQWGGLTFRHSDEGISTRANLALATSLSNVCKLLDVELVTDHNIGASGYWGRTGHFTIGHMAIDLIADTKLKALMSANADSISFDLDTINHKTFDKKVGEQLKAGQFAHLADVPDDVWKHRDETHPSGRKGGRDTQGGQRSSGPEHPNHYADIDAMLGPNGEMFRALCLSQPNKFLTIGAWQDFYKAMNDRAKAKGFTTKDIFEKGILPFRVWQFFEAMTGFVKTDIGKFVAAAGILAHYVGDSCQPMHGSEFGKSDESRDTTTGLLDQKGKLKKFGDGAHSAYETDMISQMADTLFPLIKDNLPAKHGLPLANDGRAAALDIVRLMDETANKIRPMEILETFEKLGGVSNVANQKAMWNTKKLGERTAEVMALGIRHLAMIWEAAWKAGGGASVAQSKIKKLKESDLRGHYENIKFVPSMTINDIGSVLPQALGAGTVNTGGSAPKPGGPAKKKVAKKAAKKTAKKTAKKKKAAAKKKTAVKKTEKKKKTPVKKKKAAKKA